jgi:hypothetical protein
MAEYLTNTADLTKVASAIREKGGTSAQLAFPDGFVSAVQAIEGAPDLQIVVTTSAGATVTATKGSKTVSGTADASGNCTLIVDEVGTWTVTAATASTTKTADVVVGTANVDLVMIDPVFGNNSWAAIIKACQEKQVPNTWNVGDSCNMTINKKTYAIDIIGKNHDDYADGSGKAPLTFQLHDCYSQAKMHGSAGNNNWKTMAMRTSTLPAILKKMPAEVQEAIREVTKLTGVGQYSKVAESTADKLFILSDDEVDYRANSVVEGSAYSYYTTSTHLLKTYNGAKSSWWLRSPATDNNHIGNTEYVDKSGSVKSFSPSETSYGVSFGFCF